MKRIRFKSGKFTVLLVQLFVIVGLFVGMWWLHGQIQSVREDTLVQIKKIDERVGNMQHISTLSDQLAQREHDIDRLEDMVLTTDQLGAVLQELEFEAEIRNLTVTTPGFTEVVSDDGTAQNEVSALVSVEGDPVTVLNYFHAIEHLPFLSGVSGFTFSTNKTTLTSSGAALPVAPVQGAPGTGDAGPIITDTITAQLRMNFVVMLESEEGV